jgi:signal transduction histidine kinase
MSAADSGSEGRPFEAFTDRRKYDRSGLGLGLSIARKAVRSSGGDINFRNLPGTGCSLRDRHAAARPTAPVPIAST